MSLVECRYNPYHRMKATKRAIHEQRCPDRLSCKIKYKQCPYNPSELIKEEDYEKHILECKSRPNITVKEEEEIKRDKALNDLYNEREQILYARQKYYKNCVEGPEIPGISKTTQKKNKKKQNKYLKKKFCELNKKEASHFAALADKVEDVEFESHHIDNFTADKNFYLGINSYKTENKNKIKSFEIKNEEIKEKETNESISTGKNSQTNENNKENNPGFFYEYDPNEEDRIIDKFSVYYIIPDEIKQTLFDISEE